MTNSQSAHDSELLGVLEDLRHRLTVANQGTRRQALVEWKRAHDRPGISESVAHSILSTFESCRLLAEDELEPTSPKLVLVIHGIRDQGEWMELVKARLQSDQIVVQPLDFEYFDAVRFMTGWGAKSVVERVLAKVRQAKADCAHSELIAIGHSFGTHVIATILQTAPDIRFDRVVFCGSVVPRYFRSDLIPHCPRIVNECGGRDIWPIVAQGFCLWRKYGAGGVWGLRTYGIEDRFHDVGHSDYLKQDFIDKYWKPYIVNDQVVVSDFQAQRRSTPVSITFLGAGWRVLFYGLIGTAIFIAVAEWASAKGIYSLGMWAIAIPALVWLGFLIWMALGIYSYCNPVRRLS